MKSNAGALLALVAAVVITTDRAKKLEKIVALLAAVVITTDREIKFSKLLTLSPCLYFISR